MRKIDDGEDERVIAGLGKEGVWVEVGVGVVEVGFGFGVEVGVGSPDETVIVVICEAEPPEPVQVNVYVAVCEGAMVWVLETAFAPDHPPEAEQKVVFKEDQVIN